MKAVGNNILVKKISGVRDLECGFSVPGFSEYGEGWELLEVVSSPSEWEDKLAIGPGSQVLVYRNTMVEVKDPEHPDDKLGVITSGQIVLVVKM
jgi:hypothetical protein